MKLEPTPQTTNKYTENDYIQAGYKFERGRMKLARFEEMLKREPDWFKFQASALFNRGRQEARS